MVAYKTLNDLLKRYEAWVRTNPNVVADLETLATWSSYFVAGKINKSPIVSELVYSLSKLLTFFNDRIIEKSSRGEKRYANEVHEALEVWMTVIHYCEVLFELVSRSRWGDRGKWRIASLLQVLKCVSSLVLLYKYKRLPVLSPPLPRIQRSKLSDEKTIIQRHEGYELKRSGRIIRKVEGAPSALSRNWQSLEELPQNVTDKQLYLSTKLRLAESIFVMKPIVHLGSVAYFGSDAWKQWLISLGIDLLVLKLYSKEMENLSYQQRLEISRRKLSLVLYLLRSPMYNKYSKDVVERFLKSAAKNVPLASYFCNPILQYINYWQDIYFYMWST